MTLRDDLKQLADNLRQEAERAWGGMRDNDSQALAQLFRPNLGPTPQPLRRLLEPLVAGSAFAALSALLGMSLAAFLVLFIAAGLMYLIVTHVFGIELDFQFPVRPW